MGIYRNTEDDDLITQIDVFDEGMLADQEEALEGMDINNHRDIFRAVYIKVRSQISVYKLVNDFLFYTGCWDSQCSIISTHVTTSNVTG